MGIRRPRILGGGPAENPVESSQGQPNGPDADALVKLRTAEDRLAQAEQRAEPLRAEFAGLLASPSGLGRTRDRKLRRRARQAAARLNKAEIEVQRARVKLRRARAAGGTPPEAELVASEPEDQAGHEEEPGPALDATEQARVETERRADEAVERSHAEGERARRRALERAKLRALEGPAGDGAQIKQRVVP